MSSVFTDICDGVPDPCEEGRKYADISSCHYYFPCINGHIDQRVKCQIGQNHGNCSNPGFPCVFDIYTSECIHPQASFDCVYRCQTTIIPSTQPLDVTTTTGVEEVTKEFTMVSEITDFIPKNTLSTEVTATTESHTTEKGGLITRVPGKMLCA